MAKPQNVVAVTEIYVDGNLAERKAQVVKDPIDYQAWAIGIGIVLFGLWMMVIPLEAWRLFGG